MLIVRNTGVQGYLAEEFYIALGGNKTMKHVNLDHASAVEPSLLGKAVAMNAYKNGSLNSLSMVSWISSNAHFLRFI